jgi:hypothetical protein
MARIKPASFHIVPHLCGVSALLGADGGVGRFYNMGSTSNGHTEQSDQDATQRVERHSRQPSLPIYRRQPCRRSCRADSIGASQSLHLAPIGTFSSSEGDILQVPRGHRPIGVVECLQTCSADMGTPLIRFLGCELPHSQACGGCFGRQPSLAKARWWSRVLHLVRSCGSCGVKRRSLPN